MTNTTYSPISPYAATPQVNIYLEYLDYWQGSAIAPRDGDQIITLGSKYVNRPDLLSQDLYGSPGYWWVFMLRNPDLIKDPIYDMKAGLTMYAPAKGNLSAGGA